MPVLRPALPALDPAAHDLLALLRRQALRARIMGDGIAEDRGRLREQIAHLSRELLRIRGAALADLLQDRRVGAEREAPELPGPGREAEALARLRARPDLAALWPQQVDLAQDGLGHPRPICSDLNHCDPPSPAANSRNKAIPCRRRSATIWLSRLRIPGSVRRNSFTASHWSLTRSILPRSAARAIWFTPVPIRCRSCRNPSRCPASDRENSRKPEAIRTTSRTPSDRDFAPSSAQIPSKAATSSPASRQEITYPADATRPPSADFFEVAEPESAAL